MLKPTKKHTQQSLIALVLVFSGALLLSLPSLYNQYPFLYFDSSYYLLNSKFFSTDWLFLWRPLTYSFFLQFSPSSEPLSFFIGFQNFLTSALLFFVLRDLFPEIRAPFFLACIMWLYLTPLPLFSNYILPDVFSGLLALVFGWYLLKPQSQRLIKLPLLFIFSALHQSNLLTMIAITFWFFLYKKFKIAWRPLFVFAIVMPLISIPVLHGYFANTPSVSNATHALIFSRLMTFGIAQQYLDEECAQNSESYLLCQKRDLPFHIWDWSSESQIGALGGLKTLNPEFRKINSRILTQPIFVWHFLSASIQNVVRQWLLYSKPLVPSLDSNVLNLELKQYSSSEYLKFKQQNFKNWSYFEQFGWYFYLVTGQFILLGLCILWFKKRLDKRITVLLKGAVFYYIFNGLFCGLLTDPLDRYSARIIWVFGFLLFIQLMLLRINKTTENA